MILPSYKILMNLGFCCFPTCSDNSMVSFVWI
jgi:hypothetical protein